MGQGLSAGELRGRSAVITGGASGIGLAVAEVCADLGMRVVVADVDEAAGSRAAAALRARGADAAAVRCDVADEASVAALRDAAYARGRGDVALLFLNAGFSIGGSAYRTPMAQWRKQLDVNLFGVLHGVQAFVPSMVAQGTRACIVATSSFAGLINTGNQAVAGGGAPYSVSKHGVTLAMEGLQHELRSQKGCAVTAHVLCPGLIATNFVRTTVRFAREGAAAGVSKEEREQVERGTRGVERAYEAAATPASAAAALRRGLEREQFYIIAADPTQPEETVHEMLRIRADDIAAGAVPLSHALPRGDPRGTAARRRISAATGAALARAARASPALSRPAAGMLIGGALVAGGGPPLPVADPSTAEVFASCPTATEAQVDAAVRAARAALPGWAALPAAARREHMLRAGRAVQQLAPDLAALLVREQGKSFKAAQMEARGAAMMLDLISRQPLPAATKTSSKAGVVELVKVPVGVIGAICPWNFPVSAAQAKICPAIHCGCTIVLKPAPETPLATLLLGEAYKQALPPGVVNIVAGAGDVGRWVVEHPGVDKVSFTGSVATGQAIMRSAAAGVKRLTLELGGNDAAIVLGDVDPSDASAVRGLWNGAFANTGQACIAIKRLYVPRTRAGEWAHALAAHTKTRRFGDGFEPGVEFGPINNKKQYDRVVSLVDGALGAGGTAVVGGKPTGQGWHYPATIITGLADDAALVQEEQFGPVLPLLVYDDVADAIRRANATAFGLGASVWTKDAKRAAEVAAQLDAGTVWINQHAVLRQDVPFGGIKTSGVGKENGVEGLEAFFVTKVINASSKL